MSYYPTNYSVNGPEGAKDLSDLFVHSDTFKKTSNFFNFNFGGTEIFLKVHFYTQQHHQQMLLIKICHLHMILQKVLSVMF